MNDLQETGFPARSALAAMADTTYQTCNWPLELGHVEVRPIRPDERGAWDALVAAHHYLGLRSLFGKTLRYVATVEGHWLALLGWQAAALKCAARDDWIGWPRVLHYQRLHLLANNARFLILPCVGQVPNLASRSASERHTPPPAKPLQRRPALASFAGSRLPPPQRPHRPVRRQPPASHRCTSPSPAVLLRPGPGLRRDPATDT